MNFNRNVLFKASLRLIVWVAIVAITWHKFGAEVSLVWPLLAWQHRLGRDLRG